jgi:hypothetical protein
MAPQTPQSPALSFAARQGPRAFGPRLWANCFRSPTGLLVIVDGSECNRLLQQLCGSIMSSRGVGCPLAECNSDALG